MQKEISRRQFLQGCSLSIAAMSGARLTHLSFNSSKGRRQAAAQPAGTLVLVFLRGGWDALSVVTPLEGEDRKVYEAARPGIRIPARSLLRLDDRFGMHPALEPLVDLYRDGQAAWVHAVGLNVDTRSHFDAQEFIDLGTPGVKSTPSGWLTRHLRSMDAGGGQVPVIASPAASSALLDTASAVSLNELPDLDLWDGGFRAEQQAALRGMYAGSAQVAALRQGGLRTLEVLDAVAPYLEGYEPAAGVDYGDGEFGMRMRTVAQMVKMDVGLQVATVDFGGWDTHEYQNDGPGGYLTGLLGELGRGLSGFYNDMAAGGYTRDLSVVVISEFGRRLAQNDSQGTDHGHGSLMLALGSGLNGGQVYGSWPGLAQEQLYDRADLAVTTDFRQVLSELLLHRLNDPHIEEVFPGFEMGEGLGVFG